MCQVRLTFMYHASNSPTAEAVRKLPDARATLVLLKPITWFPPLWAFLCGIVSSGASIFDQPVQIAIGFLLVGPLVCGMSQAANDWCDRHVDQINEPYRPIPSGRIPGRWGLWIALGMSIAALILSYFAGPWVFLPTIIAVISAWAYSAEPLRLKRSGIWGPGLVGLSYETLPWLTGVALMTSAAPSANHVAVALLYGLGAFGIMTLNDFKALKGDMITGVRSLPVMLGPKRAASIACLVILGAQLAVVAVLIALEAFIHGGIIMLLLLPQLWAMSVLLKAPKEKAPWFNGTGVLLYITGMMVSAHALRGLMP